MCTARQSRAPKERTKPYTPQGEEGKHMATTINDGGTRIMNDHGVYPLLDTLTNDALLSTVCDDDVRGEYVNIYVDAKGFHLVWREPKKDSNGYAVWNGGDLLMDTKSVDVTAKFAAKLDYDGEAPDFDDTAKAKDDGPWFAAAPEVEEGHTFTLSGLKDDKGIHLSHIYATDGHHAQLLLAPGAEASLGSLEHTLIAMAINSLPADAIERADTDADILSKAKELLK